MIFTKKYDSLKLEKEKLEEQLQGLISYNIELEEELKSNTIEAGVVASLIERNYTNILFLKGEIVDIEDMMREEIV